MARVMVNLCIDNVPQKWLKVYMEATPAQRWIMMTNAHRQEPPMEVSFTDPVVVNEGADEESSPNNKYPTV